jgi:hypothetical protein
MPCERPYSIIRQGSAGFAVYRIGGSLYRGVLGAYSSAPREAHERATEDG